MPVHDLYSYRQRLAKGDTPDIFVYDKIPESLRVQIIHIWDNTIGEAESTGWREIHDVVALEHGVFRLSEASTAVGKCKSFLLDTTKPIEHTLDLIEYSFQYIDKIGHRATDLDQGIYGTPIWADDAINELNQRFLRAGVGFQYECGQIFKIESEFIHSRVIRPALWYLNQDGFSGPCEEFLKAHAHYRTGEMKEAIVNANSAFESTLKVICDQRGWEYHSGANASDLLKILGNKNLFPDYLDKSFKQLAATLKSGLPKLRNEEGAHGQGATPKDTPDYIAAYALHLAAAKILFLVKAHTSGNCHPLPPDT